jgi:outer membrane lipoprotein-sorting protein
MTRARPRRGRLDAIVRRGRPAAWLVGGLLFVRLLLVGEAPASSAGEVEKLLARIRAAGQRTRTLQASFVQRRRVPLYKSEVVSQGRLLFKRPDRQPRESYAPDAAVVVLRGQRAEVRIPGEPPRRLDLEEGSALGSLVGQMLVWFGVRPAADLYRHYRVSLSGGTEPQLELLPRDSALRRRITSLKIKLGQDLAPKSVELAGSEGDRTRIEFGAVQRNQPVAEALFR